MPTNDAVSGLSNCYVFKSQLQEYAQKFRLTTPEYETSKEGPSHEPTFRSTVIVNGIRYDSLSGFFNRKAAEQSAAEVALQELAKAGELGDSSSVQDTGLCKNLLQEYAQKMNYAIPLYQFQKDEATTGRAVRFTCSAEIGGIKYIGAASYTKREAEISAARTALLAILPSASASDKPEGNSQLTVLPTRKRPIEPQNNCRETDKTPKTKKARFRKNSLKKRLSKRRHANVNSSESCHSTEAKLSNESNHISTEVFSLVPNRIPDQTVTLGS